MNYEHELDKGGSRHKLDQCLSENPVFISEQSEVSDQAVPALNYIERGSTNQLDGFGPRISGFHWSWFGLIPGTTGSGA